MPTTTIFVRDGWLVIEVADTDSLREQLTSADGERLVSVGEVSERTGFTAGAFEIGSNDRSSRATRVGKEYRVREGDLATLLDGKTLETVAISKRIGRNRKAVSV